SRPKGLRHETPFDLTPHIIAGMLRRVTMAFACAAVAALGACPATAPAPAAKPEPPDARVENLADVYLDAFFDRNREAATQYGGPGRHHDKLGDNTLAATKAWDMREDAWLNDLKQIDPSAIGASSLRATYAILRQTLEGDVAKRVCRDE